MLGVFGGRWEEEGKNRRVRAVGNNKTAIKYTQRKLVNASIMGQRDMK